jgi:transketolase
VEHYAALRAIPGLTFVRPGDPNEAVAAWRLAVEERHGPVALALTRQKLPVLTGTADLATEGVARGGYVLADAVDQAGEPAQPDVILLATGSELSVAMDARAQLTAEGIRTRLVSLPSWERFEAQSKEYRDSVLPPEETLRISVEAGVSLGWDRWVGPEGAIIAIDRFGASAPAGDLFPAFGISAAHVASVARQVMVGDLRGVVSAPFQHEAPAAPETPEARS